MITVRVSVGTSGSGTTITADNTAPQLILLKPTAGLYLFNTKLISLGNIIVIGPLTIEVAEKNDIVRAEFYIGDELMYTDDEPGFNWYMNLKMIGTHELTVVVYDGVGNAATTSVTMAVFNFFGD